MRWYKQAQNNFSDNSSEWTNEEMRWLSERVSDVNYLRDEEWVKQNGKASIEENSVSFQINSKYAIDTPEGTSWETAYANVSVKKVNTTSFSVSVNGKEHTEVGNFEDVKEIITDTLGV